MCYKVDCNICHKATWKGCGLHIESALKGISIEDRCIGWPIGKCTYTKEDMIKASGSSSTTNNDVAIKGKECVIANEAKEQTNTTTKDNCQVN